MPGAPFVRRAYPGPGSSSVADLILRGGEAAAQAEARRGEVRANRFSQDAARQQDAARSIAGMISGAGQQIAQYAQDAPRRELVQLQLDQAKAEATNTKLVTSAVDRAEGDLAKAIVLLESEGHASAASALRDKRREQQAQETTAVLNGYKVKAEQFGEANRLVAAAQADPAMYPKLVPRLRVLADSIEQGWSQFVPEHYDPKALKAFDQFTLTETERATRQKNLAEQAERERAGLKSQSELEDWGKRYLAEYFATLDPQQAKPEDFQGAMTYMRGRGVSPLTLSLFGDDLASAQEASRKILAPKPTFQEPGSLADLIASEEKRLGRPLSVGEKLALERKQSDARDTSPEGGAGDVGVSDLTDQAIENAAYNFAMSGGERLPALGVGKDAKKAKARIMNRAAEMFGALEGPAQKAAIEAATNSYKKRQEQLSSLSAFEDTAKKNLTRFLELARGIPDLGSPAFNKPVRQLSREFFGSEKMARFQTSLTAVVPEFARIITNPNLVGVLSDDARHHVETMLSGDYTIPMLVGAAEELVRDADNRKTSLQDESAALMRMLQAPPRTRGGASAVPDAVKQALQGAEPGHDYELSDGTTWTVAADGSIRKKGG